MTRQFSIGNVTFSVDEQGNVTSTNGGPNGVQFSFASGVTLGAIPTNAVAAFNAGAYGLMSPDGTTVYATIGNFTPPAQQPSIADQVANGINQALSSITIGLANGSSVVLKVTATAVEAPQP